MKKKIVLILSIMAIAICIFALSVSASDYGDYTNFILSDHDGFSSYVFLNNDQEFSSSIDDVFGLGRLETSSGDVAYVFKNIEFWHSLFQNNNVIESSDLLDVCQYLVDIGAIGCGTDKMDYELISYYNEYFVCYQKYLKEFYSPTYEDGLADGAAEYKKSYEYLSSLDVARTEGRSEGKMDFVKSKEYANALSIEYDKGYTDGLNEDGYEATDIIGSVLGVGFLGALAIVCLMLFSKKKRRR